jgi:hypothetical protein
MCPPDQIVDGFESRLFEFSANPFFEIVKFLPPGEDCIQITVIREPSDGSPSPFRDSRMSYQYSIGEHMGAVP